jgi:hypothetical protein
MGKNYRDIYEQTLNIKLRPGVSSIHHISWNHYDCNIKNLVAITQDLHDRLNMTVEKFPKLLKILLRCQVYWLIKNKNLIELRNHIDVYLELNSYIQLRNVIKKYGIQRAIEKFGIEMIEKIYDLKASIEKKERNECA